MPIPALIVLRIPEPLSRFTFKNCLIHTPNVSIHGWTLPVSIGQKPGRDRVQLDAANRPVRPGYRAAPTPPIAPSR